MNLKTIAAMLTGLFATASLTANAQETVTVQATAPIATPVLNETYSALEYEDPNDSTIFAPDGRRWVDIPDYEAVGFALDTVVVLPTIPDYFFRPAVFDHFEFPDTVNFDDRMFSGRPELRWIEELNVVNRNMASMRYHLFYRHPQLVKYNINMLPQAPKFVQTVIDPLNHTIEIRESLIAPVDETTLVAEEVKKRHWIRNFSASLQFSQAYVSPNWYQGGNNNLNLLGQLYYNVKLNPEFHPKFLVDFTAQYKLGLNSAPDDSIRNYSISDDLLQLNGSVGIKAVEHWYYSFTGQFKTQVMNSYTSNTRNLRSAFLSPGEFTGGVGMTYNYNNAKKTFTFEANMPLLSYNMKTCINHQLDETAYGIKPGHKTVSTYGSTAELKLFWQMASNISLRSRFFTFTNYSYLQADWENTLFFEINRFLTTQVYAHLRYDTNGVPADGTKWKKLQVKELLSIGFTYKFSSI